MKRLEYLKVVNTIDLIIPFPSLSGFLLGRSLALRKQRSILVFTCSKYEVVLVAAYISYIVQFLIYIYDISSYIVTLDPNLKTPFQAVIGRYYFHKFIVPFRGNRLLLLPT